MVRVGGKELHFGGPTQALGCGHNLRPLQKGIIYLFFIVAAFSARGATREGMVEAANEDYGRLIEANAGLLGLRGAGDRRRSA